MMGGPPPDASTAPPAPPTPPVPGQVVRGGPNSRGFVITIRCTSPDANALQLVFTQFLNNLMTVWPTVDRPRMEYGVAKVMMVSANQIAQDPTRLQQLKTQYDNALRAKALADQAAATAKAAAQQAVAAVGSAGSQPRPFIPPIPIMPPNPNMFQGPDASGNIPDPNDAYKDRLTGEDMRPDWEFTILIAVQLDPPTYTPQSSTAPGAQQASAVGGLAIGQ
jgi:hypothetical protein